MKAILQRTTLASVKVEDKVIGKIDNGLVILVGFTEGDTEEVITNMVNKIINLRIFNDDNNVMNISLKDSKGSILSISQFTLYADTSRGRRPSYSNSLKFDAAKELYDLFNQKLIDNGIKVEAGVFGEHMHVSLINDGPVTIIIDSDEWRN